MSHIPVDMEKVSRMREHMRSDLKRELDQVRQEREEDIELRIRLQVEVLDRYSQAELKVLMDMIHEKFHGED